MEKEILEIAALVDRLRREDTNFRVFGADSHKYQIGPTLSETEIREFEQKHEIVLPEDYRLWLHLVGDGSGHTGSYPIAGVGPGHGIFHLCDTVDECCPMRFFEPFLSPRPDLGPDVNVLQVEYDENACLGGVLNLGTMGCAHKTYLVVNGNERGIWNYIGDNTVCATSLAFSEWVRNWAECALPLVIRERVIEKVEMGMTKTQVIEICSEDWEEERWTTQYRHLRFKNLVTQFEIDENDKIVRIIKHSV